MCSVINKLVIMRRQKLILQCCFLHPHRYIRINYHQSPLLCQTSVKQLTDYFSLANYDTKSLLLLNIRATYIIDNNNDELNIETKALINCLNHNRYR